MVFKIVEILRPLARVGQINFTDMNGMQVGGGFWSCELRIAPCALRPIKSLRPGKGRGKNMTEAEGESG